MADNKIFECQITFLIYAENELEASSFIEDIQAGYYLMAGSRYKVQELEARPKRGTTDA